MSGMSADLNLLCVNVEAVTVGDVLADGARVTAVRHTAKTVFLTIDSAIRDGYSYTFRQAKGTRLFARDTR